jgi:hypothetical protein
MDEELQLKWDNVRKLRNVFLSRSDWIALVDCQLSNTQRTAWMDYRQSLRDITLQSDPDNIIWPEEP